MCTFSFVPDRDGGYFAAMNRDELKNRVAALPPALHQHNGICALYPHEPSGGAWIGANSEGNLFAVLNWNGVRPSNMLAKEKSRGELIPKLLSLRDLQKTELSIHRAELKGMLPFRLFAAFRKERLLRQWRWDGTQLTDHVQEWSRTHSFSSSLSDERAESQRGEACERTWHESISNTAAWLRSLHASHIPEPGPYSVCVHRPDAATVSLTEVRCTGDRLEMSYLAGQPCQPNPQPISLQLQLGNV